MNIFSYAILFISIIIIFSCGRKMEDPTLGFEFGSEPKEWHKKLKDLEKNGNLKDSMYSNQYRGFLTKGNDSLLVEYNLNPDGYFESQLLSIKINLNEDTIYYKNLYRGYGRINYSKVDKVKKWISDRFDYPTQTKYYIDSMTSIQIESNVMTSVTSRDTAAITYKWLTEKFDIILYVDRPNSRSSKDFEIDFLFYPSQKSRKESYLLLVGKDYKKRIKEVREAQRKRLRPNDLITTNFINKPKFESINSNQNRIKVQIPGFVRHFSEEPRSVTDLKFNVIFKNQFNEVLGTMENCTFHFPQKLPYNRMLDIPIDYYVDYNIYSSQGKSFELIRNNVQTIKCEMDVKKIVFDDGNVLQ